jgi:hypothetical protein
VIGYGQLASFPDFPGGSFIASMLRMTNVRGRMRGLVLTPSGYQDRKCMEDK